MRATHTLSQTQRGPKCDCVCVASGVWYRISWLQSWLAICKTRIVNEIRGNKSLVDCAEGKVCESQDFNARMRGYRIPWEKSPHKSSRFSPEYYTSDKFLVPTKRTRGKKATEIPDKQTRFWALTKNAVTEGFFVLPFCRTTKKSSLCWRAEKAPFFFSILPPSFF